MDFMIEEVGDIDAAWPEIEPLLRDLNDHGDFHDQSLLPDWAARQRQRLVTGDGGIVLLARRGDRAVGLMNARRLHNPALREEDYGYVDFAFVSPDVRSRAVGSALVERIEAWAAERGLRQVQLTVIAANTGGVRFWDRAGFEVRTYGMCKTLGGA
jgi:GNAT superfamily N-acetyltransferase